MSEATTDSSRTRNGTLLGPGVSRNRDWRIARLPEIARNLDSRRAPITKSVREPGEFPYYGASGIVDYVADYLFDEDALLISEDGANLLTRSTPIAFSVSGKYWVNNHAHVLSFDSRTTQRFVEMYFESIALDDYVTGAAQPKLNQAALNSIPIPLPSLQEQERIVGLLDEAFAGIEAAKTNAEKNLQNARALFEGRRDAAFLRCGSAWSDTPLAAMAEFKNGLNFTRESSGQTIRMVGVGDFLDRDEVPIDGLQSATVDHEVPEGYLLRRDDILIVRSNGSKDLVGRCMLVPNLSDRTSFSGFIIRIRLNNPGVDPCFLLQFMKSRATRELVARDGGGANISNINQAKLSALRVPLPPMEVQRKVVRELDDIRRECQRLTSVYEQKLAALDALKKSLLHQAFSGAL